VALAPAIPVLQTDRVTSSAAHPRRSALPLEPGTDVEVRSSFDRDWKRGFIVEDACEQGYHLRRRSDGSVLPAMFPADIVRQADARGPLPTLG
jgi:hypothetical protein